MTYGRPYCRTHSTSNPRAGVTTGSKADKSKEAVRWRGKAVDE
jgi:hypothetical protein